MAYFQRVTNFQWATSQGTVEGETTVTFSYVVPFTVATVPCGVEEGCITAESAYTVIRTIIVPANETPSLTWSDLLVVLTFVALLIGALLYLGSHRRPKYVLKERKHPTLVTTKMAPTTSYQSPG